MISCIVKKEKFNGKIDEHINQKRNYHKQLGNNNSSQTDTSTFLTQNQTILTPLSMRKTVKITNYYFELENQDPILNKAYILMATLK